MKDNRFHSGQAKVVKSTCKNVQINIMSFVSAYEMQNCVMDEFTSA